MAIFRGTGGSGSSSDSTIVDAVTAQATIATTKAGEASTSATTATTKASEASTSATTASTKATEANASATTASTKATEATTAKTGAETAQTAAEAARDAALGHSNTANSSAVQTVAGSNTQVVGVYNNIANVNTVAGVNTDVTTVAGISSDVTTVAADASDIGTVSTNIANVNNVGNNIANVNAVHGNASNINTVAADGTDIGTVSSNIANVNTVAGISSNVTTVAGLESKMDTVIADASDIGAVAGNIGDVTTVAGINSDVDTVAGIAAKVTTVADNISDVQNADTNATNAASSASNASASATSASNSATTATTKATEASNSATAASNSATTATAKASQAVGSATTAGTSASTATTKASEASASATTATTKAGEAASSASAASGSATTAVTKASEASVSAASAATSATNSSNAASTWNNFYNSYLGTSDAQPSVDVLGNAIVAGALYYDTGAGSNAVGLYVYNGSSWVYSTNYNNVTAPYILAQDLATNSNDINFGDNAKAKFGASDDLQIYHNGTNSFVSEVGSGDLKLNTNGASVILQKNTGETMVKANTDNSVELYYDNAKKLETTSTGIDVTGTVKADTHFTSSDTNATLSTSGNNGAVRLRPNGIFSENGQVIVQSSGNVGIGTTSPRNQLTVGNTTDTADDQNATVGIKCDANHQGIMLQENSGGEQWSLGVNADGDLNFYDSQVTTPTVTFKDNGGVGIGTTSPASALDVTGTATMDGLTVETSDTGNGINYGFDIKNSASGNSTSYAMPAISWSNGGLRWASVHGERKSTGGFGGNLVFNTMNTSNSATKRMGIDYNGDISFYEDTGTTPKFFWDASAERLGIGTTSPSEALEVNGTVKADTHFTSSDTNATLSTSGNGGTVRLRPNGIFSENGQVIVQSSGNVGIGDTNPARKLTVQGGSSDNLPVRVVGGSGTTKSHMEFQDASTTADYKVTLGSVGDGMSFQAGGSERMRIDSSGNVGIGTTSPDKALTISASDSQVRLYDADGTNQFASFQSDNGITKITSRNNTSHGKIAFQTYNGTAVTERMRIDSSGNLLVGKTATTFGTAGSVSYATGLLTATVDGNACVQLNRLTSDGVIQTFGKDGTTVGSIGTKGGDLYLNTGTTGIKFRDADNCVEPVTNDGSGRDAAIDLGRSSTRFKDLYLSGGVHLGGTTAANKLDDYEEGTWTPTLYAATTGTNRATSIVSATYTKIGRLVRCKAYLSVVNGTALNGDSGAIQLGGLPFTASAYGHLRTLYSNLSSSSITGIVTGTVVGLRVGDSQAALQPSNINTGSNNIMIDVTFEV